MNSLKNKVQLIGNLGNDPKIFNFDGDKIKVNFSLATSDSYKKENGEKVVDTQWHNIVAWGNTAKIAEKFLKKGSKVAVEGKLTNRSWEDKEGNKKYVCEVLIHEIVLLDAKQNV